MMISFYVLGGTPGLPRCMHLCWCTHQPPYMEGKETWKTEATTPDGETAVLKSKGIYIPVLPWASERQILKVYKEAFLASDTYTVQMVSMTPYSLKATSLKMVPTVGTVGRAYIPRVEVGVRSLPLPGDELTGRPAVTPSCPLDDLLQQFVKTYQMAHLNFVYFTVCKFYLKKEP